ncbi:sulfatase-like hydrolase/transferase, partial [candidate division KSB1 bacterium]|nr:sulfatase-like hydrolase/transferase [candidate division KSB1 bacterium]
MTLSENKISRRRFLGQIGFGIAAASLQSQFSCSGKSNPNTPNILMIIADDWGYPHAGIYGDNVVKTPVFDSIARNGILFNNAYVSAPSCTPSRGALLTGQHFWRLGPGANLWSSLPLRYETYPDILEGKGYYVGSCLKGWSPGNKREKSATGKEYANFDEFLNKRPVGKPFCFWFGSYDPHRPYEWQTGIKSGLDIRDVEVPPFLPDNEITRTDMCDYYFEVQRFDSDIGRLLKRLEETGELENTIIVATSDNGSPFPRCKCNLYDYGVRVPLAIQWGNKIKKEQVVDDFVNLIDLAPTFLEAANVQVPEEMDGNSLVDIFEGRNAGPARDYVLFGRERHTPSQANHWGGYPMRGIRTKDFLYIRNFKPDRSPAGDKTSIRGPAYSDIDASPTKEYLLQHRNDPNVAPLFDLACGKRPADELYDLRKD